MLTKASEYAAAQGLRLGEPARAYGVIGSMLLGSVAQRVLQQSPVPVLLVK